MSTLKFKAVFVFWAMVMARCLFSQITLEGVVSDNGGDAVQNGLVELTDLEDPARQFSDHTDAGGRYVISIGTGVEDVNPRSPGGFYLAQNYPNPFNPSTVISFELPRSAHIRIEIRNILGQRVRILYDGYQADPYGQVVWDATDDAGLGVPAGVYIYSLISEGIRIHRKMLLIDGGVGGSNSIVNKRLTDPNPVRKQLSDRYGFRISGTDLETYELPEILVDGNKVFNVTVFRTGAGMTVTDIDGNVYRTVKIGEQWWLAENLKVTHYRNGDAIPNVTDGTEWSGLTTGVYCNYDNNESFVSTYGRLYNWHAVNDSRNIAPAGWHVSRDEEWQSLVDYLGGDAVAGGKMKEAGYSHWQSPNTGATNESGFSALPGGYRDLDGYFNEMGYSAVFWSSTEDRPSIAWFRSLYYLHSGVYRSGNYKRSGFSVRLVRDN
jgi:uncharacterized protein (TIGR02145 family)